MSTKAKKKEEDEDYVWDHRSKGGGKAKKMKHDSRGGNEIEDDRRGSQVKEPHTGDKPPNREHAWRKVNLSCIHAYCCSTLPFCWKEVSAVDGRISSPPALIQSLFLHPHRLLQSFSPCTPMFTTPILHNITLVAPRPFHTSSVIRSKTHEHRMVLHSGWSLPRPLLPCSLLTRMLPSVPSICLPYDAYPCASHVWRQGLECGFPCQCAFPVVFSSSVWANLRDRRTYTTLTNAHITPAL